MGVEIPQELRVKTPEGAEVPGLIELRDNRGSVARIEQLGARFSLNLGGEPVLSVLTALHTARVGGKRAVSHLCSPQFGPDTLGLGLPKHGTARTSEWEPSYYVIRRDGCAVALKCAVGGGTYPPGLEVGSSFVWKMVNFDL